MRIELTSDEPYMCALGIASKQDCKTLQRAEDGGGLQD